MGFFNLFKRSNIYKGLTQFEETPGAVLLDVRTRQEYAQGHLPGSQNVPVDEVTQTDEIISDQNTPLFVYCLSGSRSSRAASALRRMGYQNVTNIGGLSGYRGKVEY